MATARRTKTKIIKEVPAIQLTLTEGEVDFLVALLSRAGGHPTESPRKYSKTITRALTDAAGFSYRETDASPLMGGAVMCREYPATPKRRYV